jgi:hypothetical protein
MRAAMGPVRTVCNAVVEETCCHSSRISLGRQAAGGNRREDGGGIVSHPARPTGLIVGRNFGLGRLITNSLVIIMTNSFSTVMEITNLYAIINHGEEHR